MKPAPYLLFSVFLVLGPPLSAESPQYWQDHPVDPAALYNELINNPRLEENNNGEPFAWNTAGGGAFVRGYRIWKDTAWLDYAVRYYDFLLDRMIPGPDGYLGLLGRNFRHDLWSDEQVSDALVVNQLLGFAEVVLNDEDLHRKYEGPAKRYVQHSRKHVIEKLDSRGVWHEAGEYGDYIFDTKFVDPSDLTTWVHDRDSRTSGMSQKFNIANKLGQTNMYLYRITGERVYREKAEKLFFRLKSHFQPIDDHLTWPYWVPFYEGDVIFDENRLIHWTNVHPYRPGYQATEAGQIVSAYHNGIVFTEEDIQRIIHTNLKVMWNGDLENPVFRNSNGREPEVTDGSRRFSGNQATPANRGSLWSSLVDFDETIRTLYEGQIADPRTNRAKIEAAWYHTFVKPVPVSFARRYAGSLPVIEKDVPFGNSRELVVATVIPHLIKRGTDSILVAKSIESGPLSIDLYSKFGDRPILNLYQGEIVGDWDGQKGFRMVKWDGTDPEGLLVFKGEYLIRWRFADGHRDYLIEIVEP